MTGFQLALIWCCLALGAQLARAFARGPGSGLRSRIRVHRDHPGPGQPEDARRRYAQRRVT